MLREGTILLVEDNPDDELLTLRAFKKNDINNKVITARDGQEALDYLFRQGRFENRPAHEKPVLVLLDLNLPGVNGHEVLRQIRTHEETSTYPVVMLTTSNESQDIHTSYELGANSFVRKPVDFEDFIESVGNILRYWLKINLPPMAI
ncbi:two-component system response regulator [Pokkaliibacter plantistimulans]|uniref:Two-component system response regulator n=1 Tax=Proteobacteria bacterium 228 TaxID=2083153 RepID=A0A2S5KQY9_9PROT|nr:response regulator [Pokkaliibacter plantistimulans]PPC77178.1 two-component system response regulator [Pokkaliibacter plantistimulans]